MMRFPILVAALVATTVGALSAKAQVQTQPIVADGALLDVTAEGQTTRVPDVATIRAGVVTQATTAVVALKESSARMTRVLMALKRAGVADRDVETSNVGLSPQYRYVENQAPIITGYQASNSVSVRFRDIFKSGAILDALVAEGANQVDGPNLSIDKPDAALDEARTDAVRRARARAELYARASGLVVARIISISEAGENAGGTPSPPLVFARLQMADAAQSKIVAGEHAVTASVNVRFLLESAAQQSGQHPSN